MNLSTALYLTDVVSEIGLTFSALGIFAMIFFIIACIGKIICLDEDIDERGKGDRLWSVIIKRWPWMVAAMFFSCIFPHKHTMYIMLGASYLQESNLPTKVSRALELKLDDYIQELSDKKKESK